MKMVQLRDRKWFYILLSILLAIIFWLFVRQTGDYDQNVTIRNVPVNLAGVHILEDQGVTVKSLSDETVNLNVTAPLSVVQRLRSANMSVTIDVSKHSVPGEYSLNYIINWPPNVRPDELLLEKRTPQKITVVIDKLDSSIFEITPRLNGSIADGYQAGKWSMSQDTVTISGAADQISKIAKVEAVLVGENLTDRLACDVPLVLLDKDGNVLENLEVKLDVDTVYITLPIVVVKTIPLKVDFISGGGVNAENKNDYSVTLSPSTITVSGSEEDINGLTELHLGSVDLSKVVGTNNMTFPINLDPRLENVSGISQAMVTVTVNNLPTKTFHVNNIELIHAPNGRHVEVTTQMCTIVVRGHQEDLDKLESKQISIVADLSEVTAVGSISVPVKVYLNAPQDVGVIGEYTIVVKIS